MNQERSSREIFLELINQRLCQGFQIIKQMKRKRNHNSTGSSMTIVSPNLSEVSFRSFTGTSPLSARGMMDTDGYADSYMLSHGRQYHQLTLSKDKEKINVTIYKPRHPFTTVTVPYTYMLWPKTRDKFQTSQISFSHTKLPDFYWNHLDVYVCNPDENDFQLSSNVNYWQSNFILLPTPSKRLNILKQANKQNDGEWRYDVFDRCNCERSHDNTMDDGECAVMCDSFLRFLDHMNKIKRNHSQTSRKSWRNQCSSAVHIKSIQSSPTPTQIISSTQTTPTPPTRSSTPSSGQSTPLRQDEVTTPPVISGRLLQGVDAQPVPLHLKSGSDNGSSSSGNSPIQKLTVHSEPVDIVKGMKDKQNGLNFMADNVDLPMFTFISIEAVNWCIANVGGLMDLKDACLLLESMCKSKLLIHASQDSQYPFVYGYVFYCINEEFINNQTSDIDDPTSYQYGVVSYLLHNFHKRWFEVEISRKNLIKSSTSLLLSSSNSQKSAFYTKPTSYSSPRRKTFSPDKNNLVKIPLANQPGTNRCEWCHVKYKNRTKVGVDTFVFCFELQWLIATATCIYNMLQVWQRESTRCDLYLCPVPNDPFAFPSSEVTGPLRFPLFVPLNLQAMANSSLFQDYKGEEYRDFIISWMEGIVLRFGFLRDNFEGTNDCKENLKSRSYVHFTGQVFVQIPVYHHVVQRRSVSYRNRPSKLNTAKMTNVSENISQEELDSTGFYWSSNYMQTKRWRIQSLDDCQPQDLERDFVNFCNNADHRLVSFFKEFNNDFK
nr:GATOR complex protein DEPDC5 [Ciona intestinalis]|eukprot:XP_009861849.1 GATOR complex protein DEPDC5 [Ciona intestinalis]